MRMIDVLNKLAKGEIKDKTILNVYDHISCICSYTFDGTAFYSEHDKEMARDFIINGVFLNYIVELIPPKPKKYLVKFNMRGLRNDMNYLNYNKDNEHVSIFDKSEWSPVRTKFTEKEMQSIKVVREFLEDMEGKYELIGVDEDETD